METVWKGASRLASSICLIALAACSSGGGGGTSVSTVNNPPANTTTSNNTTSNNTTTNNTTSNNTTSNNTTTTTPATVSISAPVNAATGGFGPAANIGTNFTTNQPPVGTTIPLLGPVASVTSTTVADANVTQASIVYRGTVTTNGTTYPVFDLNVPGLSLSASNVRGDGTPVSLAGGGQVSSAGATMTYTLMGAWSYTPGNGTAYLGQMVTGYTTPGSSVPSTGSATYTGSSSTAGGGGVVGVYAVPSGTGTVQLGALTGDVSITANFATNTASGAFSNMTATAVGSTTSTPWNTVSITGSLARSVGGVNVQGHTTTSGAPANAGAAGFSSAATGSLGGVFYGPSAQELGGTWTLSEQSSTNGKAAFGTFGAVTP